MGRAGVEACAPLPLPLAPGGRVPGGVPGWVGSGSSPCPGRRGGTELGPHRWPLCWPFQLPAMEPLARLPAWEPQSCEHLTAEDPTFLSAIMFVLGSDDLVFAKLPGAGLLGPRDPA